MVATTKQWADLGERTLWTLLETGLAGGALTLLDLPYWVAVPIAGALAAVKGALAQQFGNGTAATVPQDKEFSA